jgi:hypothetical protein
MLAYERALTVVGTADKLGSHDDVHREAGKTVVVLALSLLSLAEDRLRPSSSQERVELVAPCRPSLSDAEMADNRGWRKAEVGKRQWDRSLGNVLDLTGQSRRQGFAGLHAQ